MKIFHSIKFALFVSFVAVAILSLLLFMGFSMPRIRAFEIGQETNSLTKQLLISEKDFPPSLILKSDQKKAQNLVIKYSLLSGSRVTLIAKDGKVIADSSTKLADLASLDNHKNRLEIQAAAKNRIGSSVRYSTTVNKEMVYVAISIKNLSNNVVGYLRFSAPLRYATNLTSKIVASFWAAFVFASIFAIFVSFLFSKFFSDPIERLVAITGKMANGEFPHSIMRKSRFEVKKLEVAVEQLNEKLGKTFRKLTEKNNQIEAMLTSMNDGVLAVNKSGQVILSNPAIEKMLGITAPEILGKTVREVVMNNEITELIDNVLKSGDRIEREISILTPFEATLDASIGPFLNSEDQVFGVICVLHDISNIRKLENFRSEFVANVSHELKTPLTSIRNYVETLLMGAIDDKENNAEFLRKIDKNAKNLSALIEDILAISKIENKIEVGTFGKLDLERIADRAIDAISEKAKRRSIVIEKDCKTSDLTILGIEDHVYRAILNILDNAVNYTNDGGKIVVKCGKENGKISISISDSGIGIPEEHIPRLFERFYRVDTARSRDLGGTGLGLAIVKHVMNIHNGQVTVSSKVGRGSEFTLIFPQSA